MVAMVHGPSVPCFAFGVCWDGGTTQETGSANAKRASSANSQRLPNLIQELDGGKQEPKEKL